MAFSLYIPPSRFIGTLRSVFQEIRIIYRVILILVHLIINIHNIVIIVISRNQVSTSRDCIYLVYSPTSKNSISTPRLEWPLLYLNYTINLIRDAVVQRLIEIN